jgi:DNA-binding MarR family transcriptional regulator
MGKINYSSYLRFLNCINAMDAKTSAKKLDAIETQLLDQVILGYTQNREILVGDLLALSHIGSQATLHGRIKKLDRLGYIKLVTDSIDQRRKWVQPANKAIRYYEKLSQLLELAASS